MTFPSRLRTSRVLKMREALKKTTLEMQPRAKKGFFEIYQKSAVRCGSSRGDHGGAVGKCQKFGSQQKVMGNCRSEWVESWDSQVGSGSRCWKFPVG